MDYYLVVKGGEHVLGQVKKLEKPFKEKGGTLLYTFLTKSNALAFTIAARSIGARCSEIIEEMPIEFISPETSD